MASRALINSNFYQIAVANTTTGDVSGLHTTGDIETDGNLFADGTITGGFFYGSGAGLTDVASVTANVANVANAVNGPVGNMTITGGNAGEFLQTDGFGTLSWAPAGSGINNGTSGIDIPVTDGNVNTSVGGVANVFVVTSTGANVAGTFNATGNVSGGNITTGGAVDATGNVSGGNLNTAGLANVGSLYVSGTSNLGAVGNVTITGGSNGQVLTTDGNGVLNWSTIDTSIIANGTSNISIPTANGNVNTSVGGVANVLVVTTTGANVTGTFDATGNVSGGNITTIGAVDATGNVSGGNITTGGVVSAIGNVSGGNINTVGAVTATGNIQSNANLVANTLVSVSGALTLQTTANGNILLAPNGTGIIDAGNVRIANLASPNAATDAATKAYVDAAVTSLHVHDSVAVATTADLDTLSSGTVSYNNGANGVGANLTTTGTYGSIDGVSLTANMRVLVKNEANAVWNGIYTYSNSTVLVRATDFDEDAEAAGGDFLFVTSGSTYADTGWVQTSDNPVIGVDPIVFTQFSGAGTYTAGTGLTLTGTVFSITNTAVTAASYGNGDRVASFTVNNQGQLTAASDVVITANAANLSGTVLASNIVTSSLTTVGNLSSLVVTGNANVGNLNTAGVVSATGNVTGGNLTTAGVVSATGNVTGGNLTTAGVVSATGNVTGGNLNTAGLSNVGSLTVGGTSNLGAVGNVTITGGSNGQSLRTDGSGVLSWANNGFPVVTRNSGNVTVLT